MPSLRDRKTVVAQKSFNIWEEGDPHAPMSVGRKKSETKAKRKSLNKKYGGIRKAKKVSLNSQVTKIVMNSGSQFSELLSVSQMSQILEKS